jgi:hypothetical protein
VARLGLFFFPQDKTRSGSPWGPTPAGLYEPGLQAHGTRALAQLPGAFRAPRPPVGGQGQCMRWPQELLLTARGSSVATRSGVLPSRKVLLSLNGTSLLIFSRSSPRTWVVRLGSTASARHRAQVWLEQEGGASQVAAAGRSTTRPGVLAHHCLVLCPSPRAPQGLGIPPLSSSREGNGTLTSDLNFPLSLISRVWKQNWQ